MTVYGKTYHPGDQHGKYLSVSDALDRAIIDAVLPGILGVQPGRVLVGRPDVEVTHINERMSVIETKELERLRNQAGKSTRRRRALHQHMQAYIRLKAENASLRERLDKAVTHIVALELNKVIKHEEVGQ